MTNPLYDTLLGRHADSGAPLLHLPDGATPRWPAGSPGFRAICARPG